MFGTELQLTLLLLIPGFGALGVDVNEKPYACDHENHHHRERVQKQGEFRNEVARLDPSEKVMGNNALVFG